jgi:hypothetical protein
MLITERKLRQIIRNEIKKNPYRSFEEINESIWDTVKKYGQHAAMAAALGGAFAPGNVSAKPIKGIPKNPIVSLRGVDEDLSKLTNDLEAEYEALQKEQQDIYQLNDEHMSAEQKQYVMSNYKKINARIAMAFAKYKSAVIKKKEINKAYDDALDAIKAAKQFNVEVYMMQSKAAKAAGKKKASDDALKAAQKLVDQHGGSKKAMDKMRDMLRSDL